MVIEVLFEVYDILGLGYSGHIYNQAVTEEFRDLKIEYERQKLIRCMEG